MKISSFFTKSCVAISLLLLLACGGGGGDSAPPAPPTPNIYSQSTIDFAGIVLDSSAEQTIEITNTGTKDLTIGQISQLNDPFKIVIGTDICSNRAISSSQRCRLTVRFFPTNQGQFTATLSIPSDDPDTRIKNISLSGVGYGLNVWINKVDLTSCPSSISVDVTVTDPKSINPLNSLFTLYQNNTQLQNFTVGNGPSPVSLVLALDSSGSMGAIMPTVESEAVNLINQFQAGDYVAICKIGNDTNVIKFYPGTLFIQATPAGKTDLINNGIYGTFNPTSDTSALYDSLMLAIDRAAQGQTGKKAVVIVSDGVDNASVAATLDQVIAHAKQKVVRIFSVYWIDPNLIQYARPEVMQRLAGETGGQFYDLNTFSAASAFQQLENVLTNNYTITYTSSTCAGTISVRADSGNLYGRDSKTFP